MAGRSFRGAGFVKWNVGKRAGAAFALNRRVQALLGDADATSEWSDDDKAELNELASLAGKAAWRAERLDRQLERVGVLDHLSVARRKNAEEKARHERAERRGVEAMMAERLETKPPAGEDPAASNRVRAAHREDGSIDEVDALAERFDALLARNGVEPRR